MPTALEVEFHTAMEAIYARAKEEAGYNATAFRGMVAMHGGLEAARILIRAQTVSDGYTALWERRRLDLTVEAAVVENVRFHTLFDKEDIEVCRKRLKDYGYQLTDQKG